MEQKTIQSKLIDNLKRFKTNTAIGYGSQALTYEELDKKSDKIERWIREKGIAKETFIAILVGNRIEFIVAIVGILKAGCAFVPMDPANPEDRLIQMINVINLELIFIDEAYREFSTTPLMKKQDIEFIDIQYVSGREPRPGSPGLSAREYSPGDRVYVYFTSGTTGRPKAIVGKNKSLLHYCKWEIETFNINERLRISQFATTSDAFLKEVFVALLSGGTLCIPWSLKEILYPAALIQWVEENEINMIHCVPHVFRILNSDQLTSSNFMNLKYLVLSGENIFPHDLKNWYDKIDERVQLVNLYGTTETTILNTCYLIEKSDVDRERIPIGKAIKGNRVIILDENMNICPQSMPGEIYIRTPYRTFGYYNDDESNRERFIQNPFNDRPDDLIFKTGDMGMFLPDGNIEFLGRIDRQVKIRGHRIEMAEIENVLPGHPLVKEAVVVKKGEKNNEMLIAYYVPEDRKKSLEDLELNSQLRDYLSEKLPDYMVPAQIVKVEEIPRKPNRKIDYESLPDPLTGKETVYVPPGNEVEMKLVRLWREILKNEELGVNENFFELGGSSLNVMSLTYSIHKEFNVRLSLGEIFNNPTIRNQSEMIKEAKKETYMSIESAEQKEYYVLSSAQKRLYVLHQLDPRTTAYNIPVVVILEGDISGERLESIFRNLIGRHESLRTSFEIIGNDPVMRIHEFRRLEFSWEFHETGEENAREIVKCFIRPFELSKAPLMRMGLIKTGNAKYILMVDMNHIITDGASMKVLIREFLGLYQGEELPVLRIQYKEFAEWQNNLSRSDEIRKQEEYWLEKFAGEIPLLDILKDHSPPEAGHFEGDRITFEIDTEFYNKINRLVAKTGTTLHIFLLAVYNVLFFKYTGQEDIIVGSAIANRRHIDLERIIGMFVNMQAMRNYPEVNKTFNEFLEEVKNNAFEAYENQDYQFDDLVKKLRLHEQSGRNPLINVVFQMQNIDIRGVDLDDLNKIESLKITPFSINFKYSHFDLLLEAVVLNENVKMTFTYSNIMFVQSVVEKLAEHFMQILKQILVNPAVKLKDISISQTQLVLKSNVFQEEEGEFGF